MSRISPAEPPYEPTIAEALGRIMPPGLEPLVLFRTMARNPRGPESSFDPTEPDAKKRVQRGGSFLCTDQYCTRYMVGTRGKGEISTSSNHVGVRLVKDAK